MARIFLDANKVINLVSKRGAESVDNFAGHQLVASPLSIHILCYISKKSLPDAELEEFVQKLNLVNINEDIVNRALKGPTPDFEDNIQLHSAAEVECDYFLTADKHLLNLKFFGRTIIADSTEKTP